MKVVEVFGIFGTGGCARGVMPLARASVSRLGHDPAAVVFVDDFSKASTCNGHSVLSYDEFLSRPGRKLASIAIANGQTRQRIAAECERDGVAFFGVRAEQSIVMDDVVIGEGAILCPYSTVTSNIRIGRHFQGNLYSYVEHDCVIGDFVTLAPGAKCNGNVTVEDHVYVGAGATIKQGSPGTPLIIGRGAVIGMGAVVTRSVFAGETVVGNPARPLKSARNSIE